MIEKLPIDQNLIVALRAAKDNLDIAKKLVEKAEGDIYIAVEKALPEKGTTHFEGVKIVTKMYDSWSDEELAIVEVQWSTYSNLPFPFKKVYKADKRAISYIKENTPKSYAFIEKALTLTPAKPSFELVD